MSPHHIITTLRDNPQKAIALIIGIISAIVAVIQLIQPPHDTATPPVAINQGDTIAIQHPDGSFSTCSVGYIDHEKRIAYTAGHCAAEDEIQPIDPHTQTRSIIAKGVTGADIYTANGATRIGTVTRNGLYESEGFGNHNDWLEITLDGSTAVLGENVFTTDHTLNYTDIHPGDKYCMYMAAIQHTRCGVVVKSTPSTVFASPLPPSSPLGQPGDSGAPTWIENPNGTVKGFWGLHAKRIGLAISHKPGFEGEDPAVTQSISPSDIYHAHNIYRQHYPGELHE